MDWLKQLPKDRCCRDVGQTTSAMGWLNQYPNDSCRRVAATAIFRQPVYQVHHLSYVAVFPEAASVWRAVQPSNHRGRVAGTCLEDIWCRMDFHRPIAGVVWPPSMQYLSFREIFNQPIAGVLWPVLTPGMG